MKLSQLAKSLVVGFLMFTTVAFAADKGLMNLHGAVDVNGQYLSAGNYNVNWEGTGPIVEIRIIQGKKQVAKTTGHFINLDEPPVRDSVVVTQNRDGVEYSRKSASDCSGDRCAGRIVQIADLV